MRPQSHRRRFVNKILTLFKKTHNSENAQYPSELLAKYKISDKTLGVGSFAVVKQCTDVNSKEECAVKIILKKVIAGKRQMLDSEIDILKHVRHAHIVSMRDIYESEDAVYIVTDLCTGGELFQRIVERGTYTESIASDLVRQMLEGLSYLHSQDIVHRDMKPENLLFKTPAENSELLITDFGLAKLLKNNNQVLTTACGTPGYVAPEVLMGTGHGKPVDLWSVGVIMYTLLSGYTPFYGEDQNQLFDAIIRGDYQFDEEYWSEISDKAKSLIQKFLTLDPKKRITADEALQDPWIKGLSNTGINIADNVRKGLSNHHDLKTLVTVISFVRKLKMVDDLVTDAEADSAHSEIGAEDESEIMFNNDAQVKENKTKLNNDDPTSAVEHKTDNNKAQCDTGSLNKSTLEDSTSNPNNHMVAETKADEKTIDSPTGTKDTITTTTTTTTTDALQNHSEDVITDHAQTVIQPTTPEVVSQTITTPEVTSTPEIESVPKVVTPLLPEAVTPLSSDIAPTKTEASQKISSIDVNQDSNTVEPLISQSAEENVHNNTSISTEQKNMEKNIENMSHDSTEGNISNNLENEMKNVRISR